MIIDHLKLYKPTYPCNINCNIRWGYNNYNRTNVGIVLKLYLPNIPISYSINSLNVYNKIVYTYFSNNNY